MNSMNFFRFFVLVGMVGFISPMANAQNVAENFQDGKMIFKLKESQNIAMPADEKGKVKYREVEFLNNLIDHYGITEVVQKFADSKSAALKRIYEIQFNNLKEADDIVNEMKKLPFIEYSEKKVLPRGFSLAINPNDLYYNVNESNPMWLWHLDQIKADSAWGISTGDSTIVVAVVDNYICTTNPDLSTKLVAGWDVADNDANTNQPSVGFNDHGTMVSGIVGAKTNNEIGVASIGFNIKVMPVKDNNDVLLSGNDSGAEPFGYEGVVWAAEHGARVINMSWGNTFDTINNKFPGDVINYAYSLGCILVSASGDDGNSTNNVYYPASFDKVISVGMTGKGDIISPYSTHNPYVDVSAPGLNVASTISHHAGSTSGIMDYDIESGTSLSSPMVSGLCGLMLSVKKGLTQSQVKTCLVKTCDNIYALNPGVTGYGAGRINAYKALKCADTSNTPVPSADFTASATVINAGGSVNFTDISADYPSSWQWIFPGSTTLTSTSQNPIGIKYNSIGSYSVTLTASNSSGSNTATKISYIHVVNGAINNLCDTVSNLTKGDSLITYKMSFSNSWGYCSGTNSWGNIGLADFFATPPPPGYQLSGIGLSVSHAYYANPSNTIAVKIWANNGGKPGTELASQSVLISSLKIKNVKGSYESGMSDLNWIDFSTPLTITGSYFTGIEFNGINGDNAVKIDTIALNSSLQSASRFPGTAWILYNTGWEQFSNTMDFGASGSCSQYIFPAFCKESATGIDEVKEDAGDFTIFPNPTTGNITVLLASEFNENCILSVCNSLGAIVAKASQADIHNGNIELNLSGKSAGVYFVESKTNKGTSYKKVILY